MKITEEWLKEQGWEISHYDLPVKLDIFQYATKMFGKDKVFWNEKKQLTIFRDYEEPCDVYADALIDNIDSVEKLTEALVLCGVVVKDSLTTARKSVNLLFEKCLANVDPETREEVRRNMDAALNRKGFAWHNALEELPEEEKEVIVIYDNGYLCYNHRPKKGGCFLRPDGEKIPYRPIVDDAGWCDFPKQATHGHKVVLWTENPMEN